MPSSPSIFTRSHTLPFWAHLTALCAAVSLPLFALSAYLLYDAGAAQQERLQAEARAKARDVALMLESEFDGMASVVQALSVTESLRRGDLPAFYRIAQDVRRLHGSNVTVRTLDGQQILNTRKPLGTPLPKNEDEDTRELDAAAVRTGKVQVSNYIMGSVSRKPLYVVAAPVYREDSSEPSYVVTLSRPAEHLTELAKRSRLDSGWWITVFDRKGTIAARTIGPEMIGKPGVPAARQAIVDGLREVRLTSPEGVRNYSGFEPVGATGWTATVAVSERVLLEPMGRFWASAILLIMLAVVLSSLVAVAYGGRIAREVTRLTRAATGLGRGEKIAPSSSSVQEIDAAAQALKVTAGELELARAEHDRLLAEARAAVNAKSRFIAAASHDLRQPMQALMLYMQVLANERDRTPVFDKIDACLSSLSALLNELLDLSKLDAGIVAPHRAPVDLATLIDKSVASCAAVATQKGLTFRVVRRSVTVTTDAMLLDRIVLNLLSNAVRYTEGGGVLIGCRKRRGKVWIEVWDTGIGIPADQQQAVFEEFFQLGNAERSSANGTGLGLAIVKKTAEVLGAEIEVASKVGRGSKFAIGLPLA